MSKSHNTKKKERNNIKNQIKLLEAKKLELEQELIKRNEELKRKKCKRNVDILKTVAGTTLSFVVGSGITVGASAMTGFGFPIKKDIITQYKQHDFSYSTYNVIEDEEKYIRKKFIEDDLEFNKLIIYFPWEEHDNTYKRIKRIYNLDEINLLDLHTAIKEKDIDFINKSLESYDEEKQTCNIKPYNEDKDNIFYYDAELHYIDKDDYIEVQEDSERNIIVSIINFLVSAIIGYIIYELGIFKHHNIIRDGSDINEVIDDLMDSIKNINDNIEDFDIQIEDLNKKLVKTNGKK